MKNKTYVVQFRRKRQGKTNYKKRLKLLKSGLVRLVIRISLNNVLAQLVKYDSKGDVMITSAHSRELEKLGWTFHKGNAPSAYLVGLLIGKKAKEKGVKTAVLDIGLKQPIKGSNIFACLKGAIDAGLDVPHSKNILPKESRVNCKDPRYEKDDNIQKKFEEIKNKINDKNA